MLSFAEIDIALLRLIHENRAIWLDGFFYSLSFMTTAVSMGILLTVFFCSMKRNSAQLRMAGAMMAATYLIAIAVSFILKASIQRNRPFVTYPDIQKLSEAGSASLPSGHTTEAFAIAFAALFFLWEKKMAIPIFIWAILVGYSRMALGVHYPADVLAGIAIGFFATLFIKSLPAWKKQTT